MGPIQQLSFPSNTNPLVIYSPELPLTLLSCFFPQVGSRTDIRLSLVDWAGFAESNESVASVLFLRAMKQDVQRLLRFKLAFPSATLLLLDVDYLSLVSSQLHVAGTVVVL